MKSAGPATLVIGLGNTLRGDDALGPLVAQRVRDAVDPHRVTVLERAVLAPELACEVARSDLVIFLDASVDGPVGQIVCREVTAQVSATSISHGSRPAGLLDLAQQLYGRAPVAYLLTSRGVSFELSDGTLSPTVAAMVEPLVTKTLDMIVRGGNGDAP